MNFFINLDQSLFKLINQEWTNSVFDQFFPFVTDLHKTATFQYIVVPLILFLFIRHFKKSGIIIFCFCLLCLSATDATNGQILKKSFERSRPPEIVELNAVVRSPYGGYSFPSNHTGNMFAFAYFVSSFVPAAKVPLYFLAIIIGYSRIYNGVHFPTDVLFGALTGLFWAYLFSKLCRYFIDKKFPKKDAK